MRNFIAVWAAAAVTLGTSAALSACSSGVSLEPNSRVLLGGVNLQRSWMAPDAKKQDLFYISDRGANSVYAYSYPLGKLEGTLTGFDRPAGLCVDKAGDIWVSEQSSGRMKEYAHGGIKSIAVLKDTNELPVSCGVDPTTGDLAVANFITHKYTKHGNVAIFKHAKGKPTFYTDAEPFYADFCGYDDKGNLFVDGMTHTSGGFLFAELAKGAGRLTNITLTGGAVYFPGQVQWDGKYVAVGDQFYGRRQGAAGIYRTTGAGGKIVGATALLRYGDVVEFWIANHTVVAPDSSARLALLYRYPAGGMPTKTIAGFNAPFGATVSLAH
jgi:hypothetical protein